MQITFIKDVGPNYLTGWSVYYTGEKADLRHGNSLVSDGSARAGWEPVKSVPATPKIEQVSNHTTNATKARSERPSASTSKQTPEPKAKPAPRKRVPRKRKTTPRKKV